MILAGHPVQAGRLRAAALRGVPAAPRRRPTWRPCCSPWPRVGITYGALVTIMQKDLKRLVAYASIVDVAFIVLGFFAFSAQGVTGGVLEMVNHGLTTGAIFFLVGIDLGAARHPADLASWAACRSRPVLAAIFLVVVMSAVGLPGPQRVRRRVPGPGRHLHHPPLVGGRRPPRPSSPGPSTCCGPTSGCSTGPSGREPTQPSATSPGGRSGAVAPLLAGIVFLGVYPRPFLDRITPSVDHLLAHVQHVDPSAHVPAPGGPAVAYSVPADQNVDGQVARPRIGGGRPAAAGPAAAGRRADPAVLGRRRRSAPRLARGQRRSRRFDAAAGSGRAAASRCSGGCARVAGSGWPRRRRRRAGHS